MSHDTCVDCAGTSTSCERFRVAKVVATRALLPGKQGLIREEGWVEAVSSTNHPSRRKRVRKPIFSPTVDESKATWHMRQVYKRSRAFFEVATSHTSYDQADYPPLSAHRDCCCDRRRTGVGNHTKEALPTALTICFAF